VNHVKLRQLTLYAAANVLRYVWLYIHKHGCDTKLYIRIVMISENKCYEKIYKLNTLDVN